MINGGIVVKNESIEYIMLNSQRENTRKKNVKVF